MNLKFVPIRKLLRLFQNNKDHITEIKKNTIYNRQIVTPLKI